jgi:hypothetical protein
MTNFVPTALAAAAIGFSALMIGAPASHAENWQPARPIHRVLLEVLNAAPQIEQAP